MKALTSLSILLILTYGSIAQDSTRFYFPQKNGEIFYEFIDTTSLKKEQVYQIARAWFATVFVSSKDVIQMEDKEAGRIIGKGVSQYKTKVLWSNAKSDLKFTLDLTCKDGKYRIQCYGLDVYSYPINQYDVVTGWQNLNKWYQRYLSMKKDSKGSREQFEVIDGRIIEILNLLRNDIKQGAIKPADDF